MLVIANGAAKSGSTWLYRLALLAVPNEPLPSEWQRPRWGNQSIAPERLSDYLAEPRPPAVIKAHYGREVDPDALLRRDDVLVLNIARDIRGAVNSHFHWRARKGGKESVAPYWKAEGRGFARKLADYHALWDRPAVHRFSYEGLLSDPTAEIERARPALGRAGMQANAGDIAQATTLRAMIDWKTPGADTSSFFRKGEADDWSNHLTEEIAQEAVEIAGPYAFVWEPSGAP